MSIEEWRLAAALGDRRDRLLDVPQPDLLLVRLIAESNEAARTGLVTLQWEESTDSPGYYRIVAQIPLTETTFDQFFNGRSGYRAQYYLSPEEGILFNRDTVNQLRAAIEIAYRRQPLSVGLQFVEKSMRAPHAKVWVFQEKAAFDEAMPETVNPPRWVANNATRGRSAPLPVHLTLDVKGAFIETDTDSIFVDELKLDRACDLFDRGYT